MEPFLYKIEGFFPHDRLMSAYDFSVEFSMDLANRALKKELNDGWYMHFWVPQHEKLLVLFRRKLFTIKTGDEKTLTECIAYAESIGIPKEHIDFSTK